MEALTAYLPIVILAGLAVLGAARIVEAIRESRKPPSPDWGCCGCGADQADVYTEAGDFFGREGYCWSCIDAWPDDAPLAPEPYVVFLGHERSSR